MPTSLPHANGTLIRESGGRCGKPCWGELPATWVIYGFTWELWNWALEWVFLWGRGRVNYLFLAVIKKKKTLCPSNAFPCWAWVAIYVWDLVVNLSEEMSVKFKSVTSELKLKKMCIHQKPNNCHCKKTSDILCEIFWPFQTQAHLFLSLLSRFDFPGIVNLALVHKMKQ